MLTISAAPQDKFDKPGNLQPEVNISGKVQKELYISGLNQQTQQKIERKERQQQKRLADMDPMVRQIKQYREDAQKMRESNQMASIDAKLKSGEGLTPEEEEYLKQSNPEAYKEYQEIRQEKEAYKKQLKSCKTKEDVDKLKLNKMGGFLAEMKKVSNNPVIPEQKKLGLIEKLLKKVMGIQKAHIAFTKTAKYQNLQTEEEATEKVKEKNSDAVANPSEKKDAASQEAIAPGSGEGQLGDSKAEGKKETKEPSQDGDDPFEDTKNTMIGFLTANRLSGYGLEYFDSVKRSRTSC